MDTSDGFDPGDRNADDGVSEQLSSADLLLDRGVADLLDEGYSPPDRPPRVQIPTQAEQARGASLAELLAAELPDLDIDAGDSAADHEPEDPWTASGRRRSGRLVDPDGDGRMHIADDISAADVGIDGGAASAEEAAMHVIDPDDEGDQDGSDDGGADSGVDAEGDDETSGGWVRRR